MLVIPAGALTAAVDAQAVDAKAAYQIIIDRNPFGLRPPAPPPSAALPDAPPPKPPATFKLVGITSIQSPKKALILKTESAPNSKPKYLRIEEGGRDGDVDVLAIDAKGGTVKIEYAGSTSVLKFEKENVKAAAAAAPQPNYAAMPGGGLPPPPAMNALGGGAAVSGYQPPTVAVPSLPGRFTGGQPGPSGGYNPSAPGGAIPPPTGNGSRYNLQLNPPSGTEPVRTVPTRTLRISPGGASQNVAPPTPEAIDPAVQTILIEANRQATEAQVRRGELPPLPPTELSPNPPSP